MKLEYTDIFNGGEKVKVKATVTTEHSASSYGVPVIVLDDGNVLDLQSWIMLGYRVVKASKKEDAALKMVFENFNTMGGIMK